MSWKYRIRTLLNVPGRTVKIHVVIIGHSLQDSQTRGGFIRGDTKQLWYLAHLYVQTFILDHTCNIMRPTIHQKTCGPSQLRYYTFTVNIRLQKHVFWPNLNRCIRSDAWAINRRRAGMSRSKAGANNTATERYMMARLVCAMDLTGFAFRSRGLDVFIVDGRKKWYSSWYVILIDFNVLDNVVGIQLVC